MQLCLMKLSARGTLNKTPRNTRKGHQFGTSPNPKWSLALWIGIRSGLRSLPLSAVGKKSTTAKQGSPNGGGPSQNILIGVFSFHRKLSAGVRVSREHLCSATNL